MTYALKPTLTTLLATALIAITLIPRHSHAACDKSQQQIVDSLNLEHTAANLTLNGYGTRTKMIWDVYLTALYLPTPSNNADEILAMPGAKRLSLYFLREVPKEKLIEGWMDGFELNQTPQQLTSLEERLAIANQKFRTMKEGEVIHFDFAPNQSPKTATTTLTINGQQQAVIAGQDFFNAILQIWIGEHPAQQPLKDCLLGAQSLTHAQR